MNTVSQPPSASALLPHPTAPPNIWLDLIFVIVTALLAIGAVGSQNMLVGAITLFPLLYVLLVIMVRRPIWALGSALVVQNFSGLIKQALNFSQTAYLVQDAAFVLVLIPLILRRVLRPPVNMARQPWTVIDTLLTLYVTYNIIQAFNPISPSPLMALAAVRVSLLPMIMYIFVRGLLREGFNIERPLFLIMAVCGVCGALFGMYESHIGITGVKALGPGFWPKQMSRTWGDAAGVLHFRPPSIYTDAGIAVTVAGMFAFMALLRPYRMSVIGNIMRYAALLLCVTEVLVTGSRTGFLVIVAGFIYLAAITRSRLIGFAVLGLPVVIGVTLLIQPTIMDRYVSVANPIMAYQSNRGQTLPMFFYEMEHHPFGFGTGTATTGVDSVEKLFGIHEDEAETQMIADNGWANIMHEIGLPGMLLYLAMLLTIFGYSLRLARGCSLQRAYLPLTMSVWTLVLLISTPGGVMTNSFPINVYYWTLLALIMQQKPREIPVALPPISLPGRAV